MGRACWSAADLMFRSVLILLLFGSLAVAQNFNYEPNDWMILSKPGAINAIAENHDAVYFAAENGIFKYDVFEQELRFDYSQTYYLGETRIYHYYYDEHTDYFWVVHDGGISFKSSIADYWRDAVYSPAHWEVSDIGSTSDYIWIRSGAELIALDSFSGRVEEPEDFPLQGSIT